MLEKITYPAILNKNTYEDRILYNVTFPDISSANTYGVSIHEARENAEILLRLLLDDMSEYPKCSDVQKIQNNYPDSIISLITVDVGEENEIHI